VKPERQTDAARAVGRWYRQPLAWLAALVLAASLGAIAVTIVVAERYPDDSLPVTDRRVLKAPVAREPDAPSTSADSSE
jgi:hypothetical protein